MTRRLLILNAGLALSLGLRMWLVATPVIPPRQQLADFPRRLGDWKSVSDGSIPARLEGVLAADDYILRSYADSRGRAVDLFVSYYRSVTAGEGPHSPKNCLPGSGWEPTRGDRVAIGQLSNGEALWANRYVVEKDGQRALVLYWYREQGRTIASEYKGKMYFLWDAAVHGRRDMGLVRIVVPISAGSNSSVETEAALEFARETLRVLPRFLPD